MVLRELVYLSMLAGPVVIHDFDEALMELPNWVASIYGEEEGDLFFAHMVVLQAYTAEDPAHQAGLEAQAAESLAQGKGRLRDLLASLADMVKRTKAHNEVYRCLLRAHDMPRD